jgi:branched-chain amino acid transport system substrate-binding protein
MIRNALLALCLLAAYGPLATAAEPFRIGVIADMTGVYSSNGGPGAVVAAQMAVEDFGKELVGRPIEILSADYQNKVDIASSIVRRWFDVDGVQMVIESTDSAAAVVMQKLGSERKRITIAAGSGTTALTNKECTAYGIHYVYDTYALAAGAAQAVVGQGGKSWYFITADYAFGQALQSDTSKVLRRLGGTVVGSTRHPLATSDYAPYLLQAQASGAQVVAFANSGTDTSNSVKQAVEFGLPKGGQTLVGLLMFNTDVKAIGLPIAQGMQFVTSYDWNYDDATRAFGRRFYERFHSMPTMTQAGIYSAVSQYLQAVRAVGDADADKVMARLRDTTFNDFFSRNGHLRRDGTMVHDMFLAQAKKPQDSKEPWDLVEVTRVIPGEQAFQTLAEGSCPLAR